MPLPSSFFLLPVPRVIRWSVTPAGIAQRNPGLGRAPREDDQGLAEAFLETVRHLRRHNQKPAGEKDAEYSN